MSAEHFPSENSPLSPRESVDDAPRTYEQTTDQSDNTGSFIHDGGAQLAENLSKIASKQGPEGIQDYLTDILASTEDAAFNAERAAAFTLLAERQKQYTREQIVHAGAEMSSRIGAEVHLFDDEALRSKKIVSSAMLTFQDSIRRMSHLGRHPQLIQRSLEGARATTITIDTLTAEQTQWEAKQLAAIDTFQGALAYGKTKETLLGSAQESLLDPNVEPKDLSKIIDPVVVSKLAREFPTDDSASEFIATGLNPTANEVTLETIHTYDTYSKAIRAVVEKSAQQSQQSQERNTAHTALRAYLLREGSEPFARTRDVEDRHIQSLVGTPETILKTLHEVLQLHEQLLQRIGTIRPTLRANEVVQEAPTIPEEVIEMPTEVISQPVASEQSRVIIQPDYASAKGMKETISPTAEKVKASPDSAKQPSAPTAEPYVSPYEKGYTQASSGQAPRIARQPRQTPPPPAEGPRISRIAEQPQQERRFSAPSAGLYEDKTDVVEKQRQRPADPNAFPKPVETDSDHTGETPRWIRTIDEANHRKPRQ